MWNLCVSYIIQFNRKTELAFRRNRMARGCCRASGHPDKFFTGLIWESARTRRLSCHDTNLSGAARRRIYAAVFRFEHPHAKPVLPCQPTAMKNTIVALAVLLILQLPGFALVDIMDVKPDVAEKDYGVKITAQQFNPHQTGVTLEFKEDGELKGFTYVEIRVMKEGRSLIFASLRTRTAAGVVTSRFDVDPSLLLDCEFTVYQYGGKHGDVGYRMKVKDFLSAAGTKDSGGKPASPAPETPKAGALKPKQP
jgi:hypothetical protein